MKRSSISRSIKIGFLFSHLLVLIGCGQIAAEQSSTISPDWLDQFFGAYSVFDGSHLNYYSANAELIDETAGMTLQGKEPLQAMYDQAKASYTELLWDIQERAIDGNVAAVRGRIQGIALGQEFDIAFTTWFEVADGKIVRQIDYVDYAAFREQVKVENESPGE